MNVIDREELIEKLLEGMGTMKRSMYAHMQPPKACPVSRPQLELLYAIRQLQPISFKELAQSLNFTPGFISQLVEGIEEHGFVSRETQMIDRRVQLLQLTKKGQKLLGNIDRSRYAHMKDIMSELSDHELSAWLSAQQKMLAHLQTITKPEAKTKKG